MPTITTCPSCDGKLKTPTGAEGKKIRCPSCKVALLVAEDGESVTAADDTPAPGIRRTAPAASAPRGGRGGPVEVEPEPEEPVRRVRVRRIPDRDEPEARDEPEEPPARKRKKKKRSQTSIPLWVWLSASGAGLAILVGGALLFFLVLKKKDGYDKVEIGMTAQQVIDLLGQPDEDTGKAFEQFRGAAFGGGQPAGFPGLGEIPSRMMIWEKKGDMIVITFTNGKVSHKERVDLDGGGGFGLGKIKLPSRRRR